jgi:peptide-methionine (S)-S-oxide reductase
MRIGFGGGCHWCTEAVFQSLRGVEKVEQGFIRSTPPHDTWSEAVVVHFDVSEIDPETLIEVHVRTHAATRQHSLREKYRSAVYVFDQAQANAAKETLERLQDAFDGQLITQVLAFVAFRPSAPRFQDYYRSDPQRPFCQRYIDPKLALIRRKFTHRIER